VESRDFGVGRLPGDIFREEQSGPAEADPPVETTPPRAPLWLTSITRAFSLPSMNTLQDSLLELVRRTSAEIPDDVHRAILGSLEQEKKGTIAESAMKIIDQNIALARNKSQPICQDTGSIIFYVECPVGYDQVAFEDAAREAVKLATKKGFLRQNSVDSMTGKNDGTNVGPGSPAIHFHQHRSPDVSVRLVLKGGGCENVGAQYSLPEEKLKANRDLDGCRKSILDAVLQAQGKGCGPGILGVCIGGDRATGYEFSKQQFLRKLDDHNPDPELAKLEQDIVETANKLGIGPMGFGGRTTLLGTKIGVLNRLPASYFVSVSYMCWAYRRQGVTLDSDGRIEKWLY
jgi:fumarate hydratase class I